MRKSCVPLLVGFVLSMAGCVGDKATAPALRPADSAIGTVTASPMNAIMAVGDTLRITAVGQTLAGAPLASFDSVLYVLQSITDTLRVTVSPTGLVTALSPSGSGNPVQLNVFAFKDGLVRADQAIIQVTQTAIAGAQLSIQPVPPDSAKLAERASKIIRPTIWNPVTGQSVANPTLRYTYNATDIQKMGCYSPNFSGFSNFTSLQLSLSDCGQPVGLNQIFAKARTGTAWVHANVTVYGIPLSDSVQYTLTNSYSGVVIIGNLGGLSVLNETPDAADIAPGGTVTFVNDFNQTLAASVGFTFDNPLAAMAADNPSTSGGASGNVTPLTSDQCCSNRKFLAPGAYTWTATVSGSIPPFTGATVTGVIHVE